MTWRDIIEGTTIWGRVNGVWYKGVVASTPRRAAKLVQTVLQINDQQVSTPLAWSMISGRNSKKNGKDKPS